jgi:hypothetical protein
VGAEELQRLRREHGSLTEAAHALGVHPTTLQRKWRAAGLPAIGNDGFTSDEREARPGAKNSVEFHDDGSATVTSVGSVREVALGDVEAMLRERGLDPEEWHVERVKVNEWDALADGGRGEREPRIVKLRQLAAHLVRKRSLVELGLVAPAALPPIDFAPRAPKTSGSRLVAVTGCWQYPYHDETFEGLFLDWLVGNAPDEVVDLGDGMDLPTISRHRDNPAFSASAQECLDAYGLALYRRRQAAPHARMSVLRGNHDDRFRNEILQRAERLAMVRPAALPDDSATLDDVFSLRRLLRLDELGIDYVEPAAGNAYPFASVALAPELLAIHGQKTDARNAAASTVRQYGTSVAMAHTHRQRLYSVRLPRGLGAPLDAVGVEVGCGCTIRDGLGYAVMPDWANGFATFSIDETGGFAVDFARYADGALRWRDQVFRA